MPSVHSSPYFQMDNTALFTLLRQPPCDGKKRPKAAGGGLLKMLKLLPMLTSGCKMVGLLGRPRRPMLRDSASSTGTIFGYRKGRVMLAIQDDPHCLPTFVIELPMLTASFQKETASEIVRIALESESRTQRRKVLEEFVWAVYCNGRKVGYSIRRKQMGDDEMHVMQLLRGVSMGAGVLPSPSRADSDGDLTYMRARFDRVVGSMDSEAFYMINPDGSSGPELSIFFLRSSHF